jgi:hypothetical protein
VLLGRQEREQEAAPLPRTQRRRQVDRPLSHTGSYRVIHVHCSVFRIKPHFHVSVVSPLNSFFPLEFFK